MFYITEESILKNMFITDIMSTRVLLTMRHPDARETVCAPPLIPTYEEHLKCNITL